MRAAEIFFAETAAMDGADAQPPPQEQSGHNTSDQVRQQVLQDEAARRHTTEIFLSEPAAMEGVDAPVSPQEQVGDAASDQVRQRVLQDEAAGNQAQAMDLEVEDVTIGGA